MTAKQVLAYGAERLAGLEYPLLEATVLLCHVLDISKEKLYVIMDSDIGENEINVYRDYIEKRKTGYPSAYLTGKKEFFSRDFIINEHVLVPRPDTEILVETAISLYKTRNFNTILDLCSGSGCIAVTLCLELPGSVVSASDISVQAEQVLKANADEHNASVRFYHSDLLDNVPGRFDLIVSNPPYLSDIETEDSHRQCLFEPDLALRGGPDGLDKIRLIIPKALDSLSDDGYLLLEAGSEQCADIAGLFEDSRYADIRIIKDLAGRNRVVAGRKNGNTT